MSARTKPLLVVLLVFATWTAITVWGGAWQGGGKTELGGLVSHGVLWAIPSAILFLASVTAAWGWWRDIGWTAPHWPSALRLQWVPFVYIAVFLALAVLAGLPARGVIAWVLLNCLMVGVSEEWMCRGVLVKGLQDRGCTPWQLLWVSSALFGLIHSLNVFVTGNLANAVAQSCAAGMSGVLFYAIRVRTRSLIPVMVTHGLYDFSIFLMSSGRTDDAAASAPIGGVAMFAPVLLVTPSLLYGLYLMRRAGQPVQA